MKTARLRTITVTALLIAAVATANDQSPPLGEPQLHLSTIVVDAATVSAVVNVNFNQVKQAGGNATVSKTVSARLDYGMDDLRKMTVGDLIDKARQLIKQED